ncbi:chromosomal replication initiator protein DnaA [Pasteurella multocida]|nr:chromosomal replication initiator protein DnaA [Pasteurella multocida]
MKPDLSSLWQECLLQLQDQISLTDFSTWLRPLQADFSVQNTIVLYASNVFIKQKVDESYLAQLTKVAQELSGNAELVVQVKVGVKPEPKPAQPSALPTHHNKEENKPQTVIRSYLNPKHVFENFCGR